MGSGTTGSDSVVTRALAARTVVYVCGTVGEFCEGAETQINEDRPLSPTIILGTPLDSGPQRIEGTQRAKMMEGTLEESSGRGELKSDQE